MRNMTLEQFANEFVMPSEDMFIALDENGLVISEDEDFNYDDYKDYYVEYVSAKPSHEADDHGTGLYITIAK